MNLENIEKINYIYTNREERAKYTALKYRDYLKGRMLDVGCSNKDLKKHLGKDTEYVGIDIAGDADIFLDLEKEKIPFSDNSFDCVVSTDVLEHLDNIHEVFDELIRVSRKYIILSLPNNWCTAKVSIISGKRMIKRYGLPVNRPKDRHKWFFNYKEAREFVFGRAKINNCRVISCEPYYLPDKGLFKKTIKPLLKMVITKDKYANWFYGAIWFVLRKEI